MSQRRSTAWWPGPMWQHAVANPLSTLRLTLELAQQLPGNTITDRQRATYLRQALQATQHLQQLCLADRPQSERCQWRSIQQALQARLELSFPRAVVIWPKEDVWLPGPSWVWAECCWSLVSSCLEQQATARPHLFLQLVPKRQQLRGVYPRSAVSSQPPTQHVRYLLKQYLDASLVVSTTHCNWLIRWPDRAADNQSHARSQSIDRDRPGRCATAASRHQWCYR